jgi:hypothetical protein
MVHVSDGGGYAGTDWFAHDTASMWRMLENQNTDGHWRHVAGLRKIAELTSTHLRRLQEYREKLAAAWPPERSAASSAFIGRLDYLIDHVRQTHDVAAANYTTTSAATSALQLARADLQRIHQEWSDKRRRKQAHDEAVAFERASQLPGVTLGDPPVTDDDLERLNNQARAIMYDLSTTLIQAQAQIQHPRPYQPRMPIEDARIYGGSSRPPILPPVFPLPAPTALTNGEPSDFVNAPITSSVLPASDGPKLAGSTALAASSPGSNMIRSPVPTTVVEADPLSPVPSLIPQRRAPSTPTGMPIHHPVTVPAPSTPPAMPPGGLIGGSPRSGLIQPGPPSTHRINPPGGVIDGATGGRATMTPGVGPIAPLGRPVPPPSTPPPATGGIGKRLASPRSWTVRHADATFPLPQSLRPYRREERSSGSLWNPDKPWETACGVPPVIHPVPEPGPVDPGPVIGLDR